MGWGYEGDLLFRKDTAAEEVHVQRRTHEAEQARGTKRNRWPWPAELRKPRALELVWPCKEQERESNVT